MKFNFSVLQTFVLIKENPLLLDGDSSSYSPPLRGGDGGEGV
jgi:hypothetical protein